MKEYNTLWPMKEHELMGIGCVALSLSMGLGLIGIVVDITYQPVLGWRSSNWLYMAAEWFLGVFVIYFVIMLLLLPIQFLSHFLNPLPPIVAYDADTDPQQ